MTSGTASTKIHATVDAYGYPVYLMISEGQRNDITYAVPVLEQVKDMEGSRVLADRDYDSQELIDYIYGRAGNRRSLSGKAQNLSANATGGFIRNVIWWKNCSLS